MAIFYAVKPISEAYFRVLLQPLVVIYVCFVCSLLSAVLQYSMLYILLYILPGPPNWIASVVT